EIPLSGESMTIPVQSAEGHLIVEVEGNRVRVSESTCKDHLCVKQGWIDRVGESITCLPNRISVSIVGGQSAIDSTTY
ncbi:MAG: NusG domain II-containing protein, partial [Caldisericaceae bacterium]